MKVPVNNNMNNPPRLHATRGAHYLDSVELNLVSRVGYATEKVFAPSSRLFRFCLRQTFATILRCPVTACSISTSDKRSRETHALQLARYPPTTYLYIFRRTDPRTFAMHA